MKLDLDSKWNRLTVLKYSHKGGSGHDYYLCKCDCGVAKTIRSDHLKSGATQSCGCKMLEIVTKKRPAKGVPNSGAKLYKVWTGMKQRCQNRKSASYSRYGGRGISVCEDWQCFEAFSKWASENGYEEDNGLSIDRVNNDGNYTPENCEWIPLTENVSKASRLSYEERRGTHSMKSIQKRSSDFREKFGVSVKLNSEDSESVFDSLAEAAEFICEEKHLSTNPKNIKKNLSACVHGKRKSCHGFTVEVIEKEDHRDAISKN